MVVIKMISAHPAMNLYQYDNYSEFEESVEGYTLTVPIKIPASTIYPTPNKNLGGMNFLTNILNLKLINFTLN